MTSSILIVFAIVFFLNFVQCSLVLFSFNGTEEFVIQNYSAVPLYFPGTITPTNYTFFGPLESGNRSELQNTLVLPDPNTANDVFALINLIRKAQTQKAFAVIVPSPPSVYVPGALSYSLPNENFNDISIPTAEILYSDYMNIITLVASGSLFLPLPAKLSDDPNLWFELFEQKGFYALQFILGTIVLVCFFATIGQAISLLRHRQLSLWTFALLFFEFVGNFLRLIAVIDLRGSRRFYGFGLDFVFELFGFAFTYNSALISIYFWNDLFLTTLPRGRLDRKIARRCPTRNYVFLLLAVLGNFIVGLIVFILRLKLPSLISSKYSIFSIIFLANMAVVVAIILFEKVRNLFDFRKKLPDDLVRFVQKVIWLLLFVGGGLVLSTVGLISGIAFFLSTPSGTLVYCVWMYTTLSVVSLSLVLSVKLRTKANPEVEIKQQEELGTG